MVWLLVALALSCWVTSSVAWTSHPSRPPLTTTTALGAHRRLSPLVPGQFNATERAAFAAHSAAEARHRRGGANGVAALDAHAALERDLADEQTYWCACCSRGAGNAKNWAMHLAGKPHADAIEAASACAVAWRTCAWSDDCGGDDDEASALADLLVGRAFSMDVDLPRLPNRPRGRRRSSSSRRDGADGARSLDPGATLSSLSTPQRARVWRYLRDAGGRHYPEVGLLSRVRNARADGVAVSDGPSPNRSE